MSTGPVDIVIDVKLNWQLDPKVVELLTTLGWTPPGPVLTAKRDAALTVAKLRDEHRRTLDQQARKHAEILQRAEDRVRVEVAYEIAGDLRRAAGIIITKRVANLAADIASSHATTVKENPNG